jgi:hypothetical protein
MSAPVAAIDCGTNSIRLLIARRDEASGRLVDLERRLEMVRLGLGVDRTGRFDPVAVERTLDAARRYRELVDHHGVRREDIRFVATSATRDAANRDEFISGVEQILGVTPEVITGQEEAELSFRGAVSTVEGLPEGPALVVDIGGGSTELVLGTDAPTHRISLDIGSVRLTERHLRTDPPTPAETAAATADVDALLDEAAAAIPLDQVTALVGVAGTVTTVTRGRRGDPGLSSRRHPRRASRGRAGARGLRDAAGPDPGGARPPPGHPSRTDRRDRRRGPDLVARGRAGRRRLVDHLDAHQRARHPRRHRPGPARSRALIHEGRGARPAPGGRRGAPRRSSDGPLLSQGRDGSRLST